MNPVTPFHYFVFFRSKAKVHPEIGVTDVNPISERNFDLKRKAFKEFEEIKSAGVSAMNLKRLQDFIRLCPHSYKTKEMTALVSIWEKRHHDIQEKIFKEFEKIRASGRTESNTLRLRQFIKSCPSSYVTDEMRSVIHNWEHCHIYRPKIQYVTDAGRSYKKADTTYRALIKLF